MESCENLTCVLIVGYKPCFPIIKLPCSPDCIRTSFIALSDPGFMTILDVTGSHSLTLADWPARGCRLMHVDMMDYTTALHLIAKAVKDPSKAAQ